MQRSNELACGVATVCSFVNVLVSTSVLAPQGRAVDQLPQTAPAERCGSRRCATHPTSAACLRFNRSGKDNRLRASHVPGVAALHDCIRSRTHHCIHQKRGAALLSLCTSISSHAVSPCRMRAHVLSSAVIRIDDSFRMTIQRKRDSWCLVAIMITATSAASESAAGAALFLFCAQHAHTECVVVPTTMSLDDPCKPVLSPWQGLRRSNE